MNDVTHTRPARRGRSRRTVWWVVKLAVLAAAGVITWRLVAQVGSSALSSRLVEASPGLVACGALVLAARFLPWGLRWQLGIRRAGGAAGGRALLALMSATLINLVTPTAKLLGGLMRARYMARAEDGSYGFWLGGVVFDQLAHLLVVGGATVLSAALAAVLLGQRVLAGGIAAAVLLSGAAVWIWGHRRGPAGTEAVVQFLARRAARADGRAQRFFAHSQEAVEVLRRLAGDRGLRWHAVTLGLAFLALNVAGQWTVFYALGDRPSLAVVAVTVLLGTGAGTLLGTPGGLGTTEAAMISCYVMLGLGRVEAAAGVLLYRALHYAVILALGVPAFVVLELGTHGRGGELEALEAMEAEVES